MPSYAGRPPLRPVPDQPSSADPIERMWSVVQNVHFIAGVKRLERDARHLLNQADGSGQEDAAAALENALACIEVAREGLR